MKILVIGTGSIGTRHIKNLLFLGYKNIAVCDPDEKKLKIISGLGNFSLYKNLKIALKSEKPDVVFVCNPTHLHVPTASLVLDSGAHIFIEKPISHNLKGVDALIKKAKKKGKTAMVACNWRFHIGFVELKKILDGKKYGKPILARMFGGYYLPMARKNTNYKKVYAAGTKGGGVIIDSGAHAVDYMENFFGNIKYITALKRTKHILDIKSEEAAGLAFEHESGVLTAVMADYVSKKSSGTMEGVTDKGLLTFNIASNEIVFEGENNSKKTLYRGAKDINLMFVSELKHFFKCIQNKSKPAQDLIMAKRVLKTLLVASSIKPKQV